MSRRIPTGKAAEAAGISLRTLQRWIHAGKVGAPKLILRHGRGVRLWSTRDLKRLQKQKKRIYGRGRGRKKVLQRVGRQRDATSKRSRGGLAPW